MSGADEMKNAGEITETCEDMNEKKDEAVASVDTMIRQMEAQMADIKKTFSVLQTTMRSVRKQAFVMAKLAARAQRPKRKRTENKTKASGFAAASELSSELKAFMNIGMDEMKSRTEVTKWLCKYIQENKLQGLEDKRYILFESEAGQKLKALLNTDKEKITYFDLQHHLKYHISSKNNPMTSSTTVATTSVDVESIKVDVGETAAKRKPAVPIKTRPQAV